MRTGAILSIGKNGRVALQRMDNVGIVAPVNAGVLIGLAEEIG